METLLNQITSIIEKLSPGIDMVQARAEVAGVLVGYEIKPAQNSLGNSDLVEKVKLFLSAKKLEGLSPLTLDSYKLDLKKFSKCIQKPINKIKTQDIRGYLGQFDHLKISSLSKVLSVLKSFFGWLSDEEIINRNPTRKIKAPKAAKRLPKALDVEELEMIREACVTPREKALIEVFYATGCRLSEIQKLNRQDINWQTESCRVLGKGSKEREVFFSWKAVRYLKQYLKSRDDAHPALFVTERKPVHSLGGRSIQYEIKKIAKRAGVKKNVHPHVLRHTMATLMLNKGCDLATIQSLLGHSSPSTTQIYTHLTDGRRREQHQKFLL